MEKSKSSNYGGARKGAGRKPIKTMDKLWTGIRHDIKSFRTEEDIKKFLEFIALKTLDGKIIPSVAKVLTYTAQTAHRVIRESKNVDELIKRMDKLEHESGEKITKTRKGTEKGPAKVWIEEI